jgi:uncharacterized protein YndB with AHSA1/START domain
MTFISSHKDVEALTLTFLAEFDASPERVWQVWEDPRQLERWWGPPTWPATFERHEVTPGGSSRYYMTGPDGEKARGWWQIIAVDAPNRLEFEDGFSGDDGEPDNGMPPSRVVVTLEPADSVTRMTIVSSFATIEVLEQMVEMQMIEGMTGALGQIDGLLAETTVRP